MTLTACMSGQTGVSASVEVSAVNWRQGDGQVGAGEHFIKIRNVIVLKMRSG